MDKTLDNKPLFSIITVVYNGVSLLEDTILSVISQQNADMEYLIIDGGSKDGTIDIIKRYEDHLTLWISEPDKGIFDAMNKGISFANGRYIALLNAGDYYENSILVKVADAIRNAGDPDVLYGNTNVIIPLNNMVYSLLTIPNTVVDDRILIAPVFCHQSSFVKRELFTKIGNFEDVSIAGDWLHFVKLYQNNASFHYISEIISNYLEGGASTTAKGFKESFQYKKQFGTFRLRDYVTLFFFHIKDNKYFKLYFNSLLWKAKIAKNRSKYRRIK